MSRSIAPVLLAFLLAAHILSAGCGGGEKEKPPEKSSVAGGEDAAKRTAARTPAPAEEPDDQPPAIDPNRMELLKKGNPAERLASKYELLVERIVLEKGEGIFTIERSIDYGLRPIAGEHHELLEAGLIDTTLTVEFVRLAEIVLQRNILSGKDPNGAQAMGQIARIRELIPEHSRQKSPPGETPAAPGTPPPAE